MARHHGGRCRGGRFERYSNSRNDKFNRSSRNSSNKRKFHNQDYDRSQAGGVHEEESVDDLMVASMAVAATWKDSTSFASRLEADGSSSDEESDESDDDESDSSDSSDDDSEGESVAEDDGTENDKSEKEGSKNGDENDSISEKTIEDCKESTVDKNDTVEDGNVEGEDDDDISDIDLAENLAQMIDDDDDLPSKQPKRKKNSSNNVGAGPIGAYEAPRTEHEIDPYRCPTDELEKLNVSVSIADGGAVIPQLVQSSSEKYGHKGCGILVTEEMKSRLLPAGTIRSFLSEQRTIVVDSFIPSSLGDGNFHQDSNSQTLDEGNMLVMLTKNRESDENGTNGGGGLVATSLNDNGDAIPRLQILGKIMEVFGPVQRPLYVIRLPDPPKVGEQKKQEVKRIKDEVIEKESVNHQVGARSDNEAMGITAAEEVLVKGEEAVGCIVVKSENDVDETSEQVGEPSNTKDDDASVEDLWSANGKMSILVRSHTNAIVYCLKDQTKLIDTDKIIRISGKGCDASNMYDEELDPSEQQYFSDDEEERLAKRGNRNNRKQPDVREGAGKIGIGEHGNIARGGGRGSERGQGKGRGGQRNGNASFTQRNNFRHRQHPQYPNAYPNQQFNQLQAPPPPSTYSYPPGQQAYQQNNYQQHQFQQLPGNFIHQTQFAYPGYQMQHNPPAYGVPPPPPPPPPPPQSGPASHVMNTSQQTPGTQHFPGQHPTYAQPHQPQQQHQGNTVYLQHQTQSSESDTVYYNYSGA